MNEWWRKLVEWWRPRAVPMALLFLAFVLGGFSLYYLGVVSSDFLNFALAVSVSIAVGIFLDSLLQSFIVDKVAEKASRMGRWKARLMFVAILFGYGMGLYALAFLLACFFRIAPYALFPLFIGVGVPSMAMLLRAFKIEKSFLLGLSLLVILVLTLYLLALNML
jgi:F0F1-type ATP synthase membrane subunit c/vacuolar-type H+-ATPase subunit K